MVQALQGTVEAVVGTVVVELQVLQGTGGVIVGTVVGMLQAWKLGTL